MSCIRRLQLRWICQKQLLSLCSTPPTILPQVGPDLFNISKFQWLWQPSCSVITRLKIPPTMVHAHHWSESVWSRHSGLCSRALPAYEWDFNNTLNLPRMLLDNVYLHLVNITFGLLCLLENVNRTLVFETRSGDLTVSMQEAGYLMDFPLNTPVQQVGCSFTNRWKKQGTCGAAKEGSIDGTKS